MSSDTSLDQLPLGPKRRFRAFTDGTNAEEHVMVDQDGNIQGSQVAPLYIAHDLLTSADVVSTQKNGGYLYFTSPAVRAADLSTGTGDLSVAGYDELRIFINVTSMGSGCTGITFFLREQMTDASNNNLERFVEYAFPAITATGLYLASFAKGQNNETAWSTPLAGYSRLLVDMAPPIRGGLIWSEAGTITTAPSFGIGMMAR